MFKLFSKKEKSNESQKVNPINELTKVTKELIKERRLASYIKIIGLLTLFSFVAVIFSIYYSLGIIKIPNRATEINPYVAVVELQGMINFDTDFNSKNVNKILDKIKEDKNVLGVVLKINSGGGSPVQSENIYQKINDLQKNGLTVISYVEEMAASGAYYIAASSDYIYANPNSLVGSIGVTSGGFGFTNLMEKWGVERRLYNAGENKSFLDPFSVENPEVVKHWNSVLENTHNRFIKRVVQGRGERLKKDDNLFTGLIWGSEEAEKLGLIDGTGIMEDVIENTFNSDNVVVFEPKIKRGLIDAFSFKLASYFVKALDLNLENKQKSIVLN